jgi:hypothetical protein
MLLLSMGLPRKLNEDGSGWFTDLTDAGFIALFAGAGFILTNGVNWETQILFRFDKHPLA